MRILVASDRYLPQLAGPEVALHGFMAGLVTAGHRVTVLTETPGPPDGRVKRVIDGVEVLHNRKTPAFQRYLAQLAPDIVVTQLKWAPDVIKAINVPGIVLAHSPACVSRFPPEIRERVARWVFPSNTFAQQFDLPHKVIPPPINISNGALHTQGAWITIVNLAKNKGGSLFWRLAEKFPQKKFCGVKGGYGQQCLGSAENVTLLEQTADIRGVYEKSAVVLIPSLAETFGLVGVEAQKMGVPVIASDLSCLRETLGAGAIFVPSQNEDEWAEAIETVMDSDRGRALVKAGFDNAKLYDSTRSTKEFEAELLAVLGNGKMQQDKLPIASRDSSLGVIEGGPIACAQGAPGQNAFMDALVRELGFTIVPLSEIEPYLWSGRPVLVNGWWEEYAPLVTKYPGLVHSVWHSGWGGSGLMNEGVPLERVLMYLAAGQLRLFWLERRDIPPPGAMHLTPIWSPGALKGPLVEKIPNAVMAALHGGYPTSPKNVLPILVGALESGAEVHLGMSTTLLPKIGPVITTLLRGKSHRLYETLPRSALLSLLAKMQVLVHPSLSETWPVMILESVYVGTPAIISEAVSWAGLLSDRAYSLCVVSPPTSSMEVAGLTRHLLESQEDREYLLAEQRRALDKLFPEHLAAIVKDLAAAGFPVSTGTNYSDELTVFVLTTGEPSTEECIKCLEAQDIKFKLEIIDRVAPMDRAFQAMLDRCETPLYVQVDADMLLHPHAISVLRRKILVQPPDVAMYVAWLWGDDVHRPIQGVKIYRHNICKQFPYEESLSTEVSQLQAMAAKGYKYVAAGEPRVADGCVGIHYSCQTPLMAYKRWKRLAEKHRALPWMGWLEYHIPELRERLLCDPTPINVASFMGAVVGLGAMSAVGKELDFRVGQPEFDYLWKYFGRGDPRISGGVSYDKVVAEMQQVVSIDSFKGEVNDPAELNLYLTSKCTKKCVFCKRQLVGKVVKGAWVLPGETEPRIDMEPALVRNILSTFPSIKNACLAGFGEPLLHPELEEIVQVLRAKDVGVGLITNGDLLLHHKELVERLDLMYLSVSLYGVDKETHQAVTGTNSWDAVVGGIKYFSARANQKLSSTRMGISYVTYRENLDTVPQVLALAEAWDCQFVHLVNVLPHGDVNDPWFLKNVLTVTGADSARLEGLKSCPGAQRVECWPTLIDLKTLPPGKCQSVFQSLGVNSWGHTSICRRVDPPEQYGGDHFQIEGMWRNPQNTRMRRAMVGELPLPKKCSRCFGCWSG